MGSHERYSEENEWYTPAYIFEALCCKFDMDVAAARDVSLTHVPATTFLCTNSLQSDWRGLVWCNPPWAGRGQKQPWIDKIDRHGNGLLLTPDRTSTRWWQNAGEKAAAVIFIYGKVKFIPGPGNSSNYKQPGNGTTIFAWGRGGIAAIRNAEKNGLGIVMKK